jgi:hypothetical protein
MEWNGLFTNVQTQLGASLPGIVGALVILAVGWLVAVIVRAGLRRGLAAIHLNRHVHTSGGRQLDVEKWIAVGAFWLILLITLVAVFNALNLQLVSGPFATMVGRIMAYLPSLVAGTVLALIAWLAATVLRAITQRVLGATTLDDKLSAHAGMEPMSRNLGNVIFWLVILLFLPVILSALELHGLLGPVQSMLDRVLQMLPDIFAALLIAFFGWLVATVLRGLVRNLLSATGVDTAAHRAGMHPSVQLSTLAGTLVFVLVFIPSLIAALDALRIEAISRPAVGMLASFFNAVPALVAAAVILVLTWYIAKFAAGLITSLLAGLGFDLLPERLGMGRAADTTPPASPTAATATPAVTPPGATAGTRRAGGWRPSVVVGRLVLFFAMLFATVEAANQLGLTQVRDVVTVFIHFGGDVLLGAVILMVGFWLANVAANAVRQTSGERGRILASIVRLAIIGLVVAMGLRAMGIADDIVNLAFGLTLGAVAVAFALSFGLGGREAAGRQMEYWLSKLRREHPPQ